MIKAVVYPLIGTALITITPFLLTFEKGQDIIRGLVCFGIFILLLLFNRFKKNIVVAAACIVVMFVVAILDLANLLAYKGGWTLNWYSLLPFFTVAIACLIQKDVVGLRLRNINAIAFIFFFMHIVCLNYFSQPLAEFPLINYLARSGPAHVNRSTIHADFASHYIVTDSVTITRDYIDTSCNNVVILVESWGVPLSIAAFDSQLKIFGDIIQVAGAHYRMYSRTRTAEREDLIYNINRADRRRDSVFIPKILADNGVRTTFLYGGDSLFQNRNKYIQNVGFANTIFGNYLGKNHASLSDSIMETKIDSLLNLKDSVEQSSKQFIAWTTSDTQFPLIGDDDETKTDSIYEFRLTKTLQLIAGLARKHPETRFIVQGDHNPILSPLDFQNQFYKRWVPFVVINETRKENNLQTFVK